LGLLLLVLHAVSAAFPFQLRYHSYGGPQLRRQFEHSHHHHKLSQKLSQPTRLRQHSLHGRLPTKLNTLGYINANNNRRYLDDQIRRREGTEIFEGRKPEVIHYIEAPKIGINKPYSSLIDERTPKTSIVREVPQC